VGGAIGPNPTDRAKNGTKRSVLTDGAGGPLAVVIAPANIHESKLLKARLEAIIIERPKPTPRHRQHLCLDKAYDNPTGHATVAATDYIPHMRPIGEEPPKKSERRYPARRWVVERTLAWLSKCRAILVRYDKQPENYLGLVQFACALLWYRRLASNKCRTRVLR
jgi:putative transposase